MEELNISRAEELIRKQLSPGRLEHSLRVREVAVRLAGANGVPGEPVEFVALLHDWAKEAPREEFERQVQRGEIEADEETLRMPPLHHAYLSARWMQSELGIRDGLLLQAVRYHPTGAPELEGVGRILFVADYAEPGRGFQGAEEILRLAERNLDEAVRRVLKNKIRYLLEKSRPIHSRSWRFWNALSKRMDSTGES